MSSSAPIAEDLGIKAEHPFLEEEFKRFAMDLDPELKVGRYEIEKEVNLANAYVVCDSDREINNA
ncbi:hypothetical protein AKJ63_00090, partial [candidate division MSBL1 archaeon SCGC-AAA259D18]